MSQTRVQRDCIDGLLLLDKPSGMTSNDALIRARRLFNARKAGHGGTLDPMASGLLPVAFGEATKFVGDALGADKTYLAEVTFGIVTETGDAEGAVVTQRPVAVTRERLAGIASGFVGEILQVPPMYSALKRDGKPLYEYARAGLNVERAPRKVTIHTIELLEADAVEGREAGSPGSFRAVLRVACSKGTYIRTLAEDLGEALGCGAHLSGLRRERVGSAGLQSAVSLAALESMDPAARMSCLLPLDLLLGDLPRIALDDDFARRFLHGQRLRLAPHGDSVRHPSGAQRRVRVYGGRALLGVATLDDGLLVPQRLVGAGAEPSRNGQA
ncbi:MAG: hypothetical protein RIS35_1708 [Pseudomonadota bacterium]